MDGMPGYRYGGSGQCYTYMPGDEAARREAKRRAYVQGAAITARGGKAIDTTWIDDPKLWDEVRRTLLPIVEPLFREAYIVGAEMGAMQRPARERTGERALAEQALAEFEIGWRQIDPGNRTELPYDFEATLAAADEVIGNYSDVWWNQFTASTQQALRRAIARAERLGLTTDQVIAEIAPIFGPDRARRIAVSELTDLMGMGAQETYRRAGFGTWEWRTVNDARVDPVCKGRNRQRYPMSVPFRKAHVNCRCWPVPSGRPAVQGSLFAA